jgi:hypothetical protein
MERHAMPFLGLAGQNLKPPYLKPPVFITNSILPEICLSGSFSEDLPPLIDIFRNRYWAYVGTNPNVV